MRKAAKSSAIVTSMFPGALREKIMEENHPSRNKRGSADLTAFLKGSHDLEAAAEESTNSKPLAELYLETSVMFADIVGFTAW